jgi:uncharacterized protein YbaP (TraB family)
MRVLAIVLALAACRGHHDEPAPAPAPAPAPPVALDGGAPDNHALALAICPRVAAPYLFRVEKAGKTSYLLGTRHLGIGLDRMPPIVDAVLRESKLAVFEVAPGDDGATADDGPGPSLAEQLGPDAWAHYRALVGDIPARLVEHDKPAMAILVMMSEFEDPSVSLDAELGVEAQRAHVATRGLEAAIFQDRLIDQLLDLRALRGAIATTATRDDLRKETADDLGDYCKGERMAMTTKDEDDMRKAGYSDVEIARYDELLLYGRNRAWIPQLERIFDDGGAFVAVGLDHLLGDRGLIAAFTRDGYRVTRVTP